MPRPVLQAVAALLALACLISFGVGVATAPERGRLPGEGLDAGVAAQIIEAQEAQPLVDERIQGAVQEAPELTPEEQAALEAEKKAKAEAAALAKAEAEKGAPVSPVVAPAAVPPPPAKIEPVEKAAPPPKVEEPVF
ncbi:MAG: hypothetical protein ACOY5Y_09380 [Pseudomonadota bacterium]